MANSPEALGEISTPTIQTPEEVVTTPQAGSEPAELPFNIKYAEALGYPECLSFRRGGPGKLVGPATLFSGLK